jgi:hypothetical protein
MLRLGELALQFGYTRLLRRQLRLILSGGFVVTPHFAQFNAVFPRLLTASSVFHSFNNILISGVRSLSFAAAKVRTRKTVHWTVLPSEPFACKYFAKNPWLMHHTNVLAL